MFTRLFSPSLGYTSEEIILSDSLSERTKLYTAVNKCLHVVSIEGKTVLIASTVGVGHKNAGASSQPPNDKEVEGVKWGHSPAS